MRVWLVLVCVLDAGPALARSVDEQLEVARGRFIDGSLKATLRVLDDIEARDDSTDEQRVRAKMYRAFVYYLQAKRGRARRVWHELLAIDPSFEPDPVEVNPELRAFFSKIPAGPKPEPPTEPTPEPEPPDPEVEKVATTTVARGCGVWLCAVPFGVGQLANENYVKGTLFAVAEIGLLAANLSLYWVNELEIRDRGGVEDVDTAERRRLWQHITLGLFAATAIAGVIDAYLWP